MAVWGGLTNSCGKKRNENKQTKQTNKKKTEKERYKHLNAESQRIAKRDKKALMKRSMQRNRGKQQNGKD